MRIRTEYGTIVLPDGTPQADIEAAVRDLATRRGWQAPAAAPEPAPADPPMPKERPPEIEQAANRAEAEGLLNDYSFASRVADMVVPWSDELRGAINGSGRWALEKLRGRDAEWAQSVGLETDRARANREKYDEENPTMSKAAIAASLAVGGAPRLPGMVAAEAPILFAKLSAKPLAQRMAASEAATIAQGAPTTLGSRIKDGAKIAVPYGFLEGSGEADNGTVSDRLWAGAGGAAFGGGAAMALPVAGSLASAGWAPVKALIGRANPHAPADRILTALADDGVPLAEAEARLTKWAAEGARGETFAEALGGGPNVAATLKAAGSVPGPAKAAIRETFDGRMRGQAERVAADIPATTGARNDFYGVGDELSVSQKATAAPHYEAAYAHTSPIGPRLDEFLENRHIRDGLRKGLDDELNYATAEGRPPVAFDKFVKFGPDGEVEEISRPTWAVLDIAKRGLDRVVARAIEENNGKVPQDMKSVNDLRRKFTEFLRDNNDDYAKALDTWAGPAASQSALTMGRASLKLDAEEISREVSRLRPGDRLHYIEGVVRAVRDRVGDKNKSANGVSWWDNDNVQSKLKAALGDEAFAKLEPRMQRELNMATFSREANPAIGSQTVPNAEAIDNARSAGGAMAAGLANGRGLLGSTGFALRQLMNRRIYRDPQANAQVADTLLEQDPLRQAVLLANLQGRIRGLTTAGTRRDALTHGLQYGSAMGIGDFFGDLHERKER